MAPPAGLEPTLSESKSDMLPLHNGGIKTRHITLFYPTHWMIHENARIIGLEPIT